MADQILKCGGDEYVHIPSWENVVGNKTLQNGGYVGDLLKLSRAHLEDAKEKGELREEDSGTAYSQAIMDSMKNAIMFELGIGKTTLEMCLTRSQIDLNYAQIDKLLCDCRNDTDLTDSKISLNAAQENKLACDCCNSSKITDKQAALYARQADGFDDNANQKLYDSQMNAWAMVFADTDLSSVTPSIENSQICETYSRLRNRLSGGSGTTCS